MAKAQVRKRTASLQLCTLLNIFMCYSEGFLIHFSGYFLETQFYMKDKGMKWIEMDLFCYYLPRISGAQEEHKYPSNPTASPQHTHTR